MKYLIPFAVLLAACPAAAQDSSVTLNRLDCGRANEAYPMNAFDDAGGSTSLKVALTSSCYLIRHGDRILLWDTGIDPAKSGDEDDGFTLDRRLVEQLAELGVEPADVDFVGISHYHFDHTGQARDFPQATLLIGKEDWEGITHDPPLGNSDPKRFPSWVAGESSVELVTGDKDVFGDRSVLMLDMPGHTPGHHALLVRLKGMGPVLLTGDLAHYRQNYDNEGVPTFNDDRADTLASFDRFKKMAKNLGATVIIQHEPADIAKLPAFPQAAR